MQLPWVLHMLLTYSEQGDFVMEYEKDQENNNKNTNVLLSILVFSGQLWLWL